VKKCNLHRKVLKDKLNKTGIPKKNYKKFYKQPLWREHSENGQLRNRYREEPNLNHCLIE